MTFEDLHLDPELLAAIDHLGFKKPTPIQEAAIPVMLERQDVLAGAATGTGKTAAFVLPALQYLLDEPRPSKHPRVLILSPTRELAFQTHKVIKQLGHFCEIPSTIITGGFNYAEQMQKLKAPCDILTATPGRLTKLMAEEALNLSDVEMVIIDEADRMLDMGQGPTVLSVLEAIPGDFQAGLFSATLSGSGVRKFAEDILENPEEIQINPPNQQSEKVEQYVYLANDKAHKQQLLLELLKDDSCQSAVVFSNKKEKAVEIADWLGSQDMNADVLHGDFIQAVRLEKMNKFKSGKIKILVATDVAARGLDMTHITHVINFDIPLRGDIYIHRIGRTGRGHNVGVAMSLCERHEIQNLQRIEYHLDQKLPHAKIKGLEPNFSIKDALKKQAKNAKKSKKAKKKKAKK